MKSNNELTVTSLSFAASPFSPRSNAPVNRPCLPTVGFLLRVSRHDQLALPLSNLQRPLDDFLVAWSSSEFTSWMSPPLWQKSSQRNARWLGEASKASLRSSAARDAGRRQSLSGFVS